ncbi:MAG: hypothetical protein WCI77_03785 [Candidatus Omnitrophota bacterium]
MKKKIVFIAFIFLCSSLICVSSFAKYAELVGKRAEIHGPYCWDTLGVALSEEHFALMRSALETKDEKLFSEVLKCYNILRIEKNTKVFVLYTETLARRAQVVILTGIYRGMSGWIPLEWLDGNNKVSSFRDS